MGERGREGGSRAKPGNQLVTYKEKSFDCAPVLSNS